MAQAPPTNRIADTPTKETKETLFNDHMEHHYLGRLLSKIPFGPFWSGVAGALLSYVIFLACAALGDWHAVLTSFLHLWQLSFSLTIFLGLWLGCFALRDVRHWLEHAGDTLRLSDLIFGKFVEQTFSRLDSKRSSFMAAPMIAGGLIICYLIARSLPNGLFPFPGYLPAFIYAVFIELSLFMVHLLAGTGFWLLYVFTKASQELSELESVDYALVDTESIKPLADIVLKLCFFLLVIIASAMPGVAFFVFAFKNVPFVLSVGTVFGMALPTLGLALSFFGPIYYLHRMLATAKSVSVISLKNQIRTCEDILHDKVQRISRESDASLDLESERLLALSQFLRERLSEAQRRSVWPFDLSSILKLSGSSALPIITFFGEQIVRRVLR